jgi:hypothetical protein
LPQLLPGPLAALGQRHAGTPFIVLPLVRDTEYAVFRGPEDWFLLDSRSAPIAFTILGLRQ